MNLVWTTRAPFLWAVRDQVFFCDDTANEGVTGADTRVAAASGYAPVSRASLVVKPMKHTQVLPRLTLRGRHDVGNEFVHRKPSGAWPEAPPGF